MVSIANATNSRVAHSVAIGKSQHLELTKMFLHVLARKHKLLYIIYF